MNREASRRRAVVLWAMWLAAGVVSLLAQPSVAIGTGAKTWIGRVPEIEAFLASAEVERMETTPVGVTRPSRAYLKPGGPFGEMSWKPLRPGTYKGYFESYRSEIAAYEIDKLLALDMVPPTVERTIDGQAGAAVMWVTGARTFKDLGGVPRPPGRYAAWWNRQLVQVKMYDDLIGNPDPNLGNWLADAEWNIIVIDHSRAFVSNKKLTHELTRIDKPLWDRMTALTEEQITAGPVGRWLDADRIRAMFERRAEMQKAIDKLVKKKSAAAYVP